MKKTIIFSISLLFLFMAFSCGEEESTRTAATFTFDGQSYEFYSDYYFMPISSSYSLLFYENGDLNANSTILITIPFLAVGYYTESDSSLYPTINGTGYNIDVLTINITSDTDGILSGTFQGEDRGIDYTNYLSGTFSGRTQ